MYNCAEYNWDSYFMVTKCGGCCKPLSRGIQEIIDAFDINGNKYCLCRLEPRDWVIFSGAYFERVGENTFKMHNDTFKYAAYYTDAEHKWVSINKNMYKFTLPIKSAELCDILKSKFIKREVRALSLKYLVAYNSLYTVTDIDDINNLIRHLLACILGDNL